MELRNDLRPEDGSWVAPGVWVVGARPEHPPRPPAQPVTPPREAPPWPKAGPAFSSDEAGDGPARGSRKREAGRPPLDLVATRALSKEDLTRRAQALQAFAEWCSLTMGATLPQALEMSPPALSKALARFGQYLYDEGLSRFTLTYAILAVVDKKRELRRSMQHAWDVVTAWALVTPVQSHLPWPATLLRACLSLALIWGWPRTAFLLAVGFLGLLRPGEIAALRGDSFLMPDVLGVRGVMLVRIVQPKMRRLSARREHVRIEDPDILELARLLIQVPGLCGPFLVRQRQALEGNARKLLEFFGVQWQDHFGLTLASLRGGGATYFYLMNVPLDKIRWHGRWSTVRTVEIYVQECAALSLIPGLASEHQLRIARFAAATSSLIHETISRSRLTQP